MRRAHDRGCARPTVAQHQRHAETKGIDPKLKMKFETIATCLRQAERSVWTLGNTSTDDQKFPQTAWDGRAPCSSPYIMVLAVGLGVKSQPFPYTAITVDMY